jgi:hypothetical protein
VLVNGGLMIIVVPDKRFTFDHRRPTTTFEHLVEDYQKETSENDQSHLNEILLLHDIERDKGAGGKLAFEARARKNHENRCLHHHVFEMGLIEQIANWAELTIIELKFYNPHHLVLVAQKS